MATAPRSGVGGGSETGPATARAAVVHSFHRAYYRIYLDIYTWGAHFPLLPQGKSRGART